MRPNTYEKETQEDGTERTVCTALRKMESAGGRWLAYCKHTVNNISMAASRWFSVPEFYFGR